MGLLEKHLSVVSPDSRFAVLINSTVAKSAAAKGRSSSSYALTPGLRRGACHQLACGLFLGFGFAPTDNPSRLTSVREPAWMSLHRLLPQPVLHNLGQIRLRRPLASWARLCLLTLSAWTDTLLLLFPRLAGKFAPLLAQEPGGAHLDFDSTLGFPGEGPGFGLQGPPAHRVFILDLHSRSFSAQLGYFPKHACSSLFDARLSMFCLVLALPTLFPSFSFSLSTPLWGFLVKGGFSLFLLALWG